MLNFLVLLIAVCLCSCVVVHPVKYMLIPHNAEDHSCVVVSNGNCILRANDRVAVETFPDGRMILNVQQEGLSNNASYEGAQ